LAIVTRATPAFVAAAACLGWLLGCDPNGGPVRIRDVAAAQPAPAAAPAVALRSVTPVAAATSPQATATREPQGGGMRFAGGGPEHDFLLAQLARARPLSFKAVSTAGSVLRVRLAAPFDAAFKPITPERPLGPMSEVSAYRLARCLGIDSVPPAVTRELPAAQIRDSLEPDSKQRWPELRKHMGITDDAVVRGVAIYWIPDLSDVGLERRDSLVRVAEWLGPNGLIPAEKRSLAASLSTMLAFDYLIGNFDRWSGGNVRGNAAGSQVYVRDHDLAFPAKMNEALHRQLWQDVRQAERFSRRFYTALKQLRHGCFERELAADPLGRQLGKLQVAGVYDRHEALLSHIDSLIAMRGEAAVLTFR
jgi:hypothetical protein